MSIEYICSALKFVKNYNKDMNYFLTDACVGIWAVYIEWVKCPKQQQCAKINKCFKFLNLED